MSIEISYEDATKILDIIQESIKNKIEKYIEEPKVDEELKGGEDFEEMCDRLHRKLQEEQNEEQNESPGLKYYYKNKDDI